MLLLWRVEASLAIVIFLCFGLGALAGALAFMPNWYRKRSALKRLQQRVAQWEAGQQSGL
jgi:putative membrane protein